MQGGVVGFVGDAVSDLPIELAGACVHVSATVPAAMTTNWTGGSGGRALAVAYPTTAEEVASVLRAAARLGASVQVQGGNTGLVGGSVPPQSNRPTVLLSTTRLTGITSVDPESGQLTALSGTTVAQVQLAAERVGWSYGVDLASRDSATIGGTVATNAGGIRVCAYGSTRAQVLGVRAVLADGSEVHDLAGLTKDNSGYDLAGMLAGSEGTLAVITEVRVRLHRPAPEASTIVTPVDGLAEAVGVAARAALPGVQLLAAEVVDSDSWRGGALLADVPDPLAGCERAFVLLLEVGDGGQGDGFSPLVAERPATAVALDARARRDLWRIREGQTEYWVARGGSLHKFDVSLPPSSLDRFAGMAASVASELNGRLGVFGHIREGNLHVQLQFDSPPGVDPAGVVLAAVAQLGGSISAEHGVGRDKAAYLHLRRSEPEIELMRAVKRAWDPDGLLNPGVIFPEA